MSNVRIIPRLDIKGSNLIKGIHLEGLRVLGDPQIFAMKYYEEGADELIYMDVVASLYGRNNLSDIIQKAANKIFIPITVGGGIRTVDDAKHLLRSGADKIAINTAAVARPNLIQEIARKFGSQAMVLSVEAKKNSLNQWEVYTDNGRERTGLDVLEWIKYAVKLGAGEILLTSVDFEGTKQGFDFDLLSAARAAVEVPIIISGGMGTTDHFISAINIGANAVAIADAFHYSRISIEEIRSVGFNNNIDIREI